MLFAMCLVYFQSIYNKNFNIYEKKIYFWACDYSTNSGEGILGRSYIKHLIKNNKNIKLININYHSKYQRKNIRKNRYIFKVYIINTFIQ